MTKNKLHRYAEIETFDNVLQADVKDFRSNYYLKGKWAKEYFKNDNPIILEIGCGMGDYSIAMGAIYKDYNFIALDLKADRLWKGAKVAKENKIDNVVFYRNRAENIANCFELGEISEIWIPFADPFLRDSKAHKRLTSLKFLKLYSKIITKDSILHLKTDNDILYNFTMETLQENNFTILYNTTDLHNCELDDPRKNIITYYEKKFIDKGEKINYVKFKIPLNIL